MPIRLDHTTAQRGFLLAVAHELKIGHGALRSKSLGAYLQLLEQGWPADAACDAVLISQANQRARRVSTRFARNSRARHAGPGAWWVYRDNPIGSARDSLIEREQSEGLVDRLDRQRTDRD